MISYNHKMILKAEINIDILSLNLVTGILKCSLLKVLQK